MKSEIARRPDTAPVVRRSNWTSLAKEATANPLLIVPDGPARLAVTRLWMCNAHLIPSALALCSRIRVYMDEGTLTPADVERIATRLVQPAVAARHKFAGDLLADLARMAAEAIDRNTARAAAEAARDEDDAARAQRVGTMFKPPE